MLLLRSRFLMEADILKSLSHSHIVQMYDSWEVLKGKTSNFIITTELMTGGTVQK